MLKPYSLIFISALLSVLTSGSLFADSAEDAGNIIRITGDKEIPNSQEIIQWCKDGEESKLRYSSASIQPAGYKRCGTLNTQAFCDGLGNRFIGPQVASPHGYQDCKRKDRIYIEKDGATINYKEAKEAWLKSYQGEAVQDTAIHTTTEEKQGDFSLQNSMTDLVNGLFSRENKNPQCGAKSNQSEGEQRTLQLPDLNNLDEIVPFITESYQNYFNALNGLLGNDAEDNNLSTHR